MTSAHLSMLIEVERLLPNIVQQYYRLAFVVGSIGSGKTPLLMDLCHRQDIPYLNVNLALSQRLLDLTSKQRPLRVRRLLADVIDEQPQGTVALDNIELLFDPALRLDPLACLQGLSRNRTLVVAWSGDYKANVLIYAEPEHPEYRRYDRPEAAVFLLA